MSTYDWTTIRTLYEMGNTAYQLSKRPGMPSKQGIQKRANKEGWERQPDTVNTLPIVAKALSINSSKLTDDLLQTLLAMIAQGATQEVAAQASGISGRTLQAWMAKDETFRDAIRRARAGKLASWMGHVDKAAQKDWKAGQWLLQTAPETRNQFASQSHDNKLEIVINIDRDQDTSTIINASESK